VAKRSRSSEAGARGGRPPRGDPGAPSARLFLALEPRDADRAALAAWRDRAIAGREDLRPVAADHLHLTLVFLGRRPEEEIPRVAAVAFAAVEGARAVMLEPVAVTGVPPRAPRLFALDLADPGGHATALQAAVAGALENGGLHTPEKRPWWPHVTLARVRRGARAGPLEVAPPEAPISAVAVTLYRSVLSPSGARYLPEARHVLP
jgi:2'-5' RNA ligase